LPTSAESIVKCTLTAWLSFSLWTYRHLRDIAANPNGALEELFVTAHILLRSVQMNAMAECRKIKVEQ
jgi:hypothetical protein